MKRLPSEVENSYIDRALELWVMTKAWLFFAKATHDESDPRSTANIMGVIGRRKNVDQALQAFSEGTYRMLDDGQQAEKN